IYGDSSTSISLDGNDGGITISGNYASSKNSSSYYAYSSAYGGAIYGGNNAQIILEGNKGGICISRNYADGYTSCGGAIYGANDTIISIIGNEGDINITENGYSETSSIVTYDGGAIYLSGGELNIRDNANLVTIKGNRAQYGGAFYT
ncbi:hypothetical protein DNN95_24470, partial [Escherichia coli]|uniref:hypothetical protein n=1 Tax=Escherichia coli TaxID=562 RepID=UPI00185270D3